MEYDFTGKIRAISDRRTHSYTLIIYPDLTFKIGVDSPEYPYKTFNFKQHMSGILEKHPDYQVPVIGSVLLDVWQVRAGSMLDNLIISDEETEVSEWLEHRWNKNLFDQSNHYLSRVSNGIFHIKNIKTNNYPVIPFIFDENWKSSNDNIINLNNFLILINNDNSLDKNVIISYEDNTRYFLKIISIISFFILILFIIFYRQVKSYI